MDMAEALNGTVGDVGSISDFGYFGVVGAEFDENAIATGDYYEKPSFRALQTLTSIMCEEYTHEEINIRSVVENSVRMYGDNFDFDNANKCFFRRPDGSAALFYWNDKNIITETYEGETSFCIKTSDVNGDFKLVDMATGDIYEIDEKHLLEEDGWYHFKNLPITDSPLLITFGNFYLE